MSAVRHAAAAHARDVLAREFSDRRLRREVGRQEFATMITAAFLAGAAHARDERVEVSGDIDVSRAVAAEIHNRGLRDADG